MSKLDQLRAQREAWFEGKKPSRAFEKIAEGLREAIAIAPLVTRNQAGVVTPVVTPKKPKRDRAAYMRARRAKNV